MQVSTSRKGKWARYDKASQMELGTDKDEAWDATTFAFVEDLNTSAKQASHLHVFVATYSNTNTAWLMSYKYRRVSSVNWTICVRYISLLSVMIQMPRQAWADLNRVVKHGRKLFVVAFSNGNILAAEWILQNLHHVSGISWVAFCWIGGRFVLHMRLRAICSARMPFLQKRPSCVRSTCVG